MSPEKHVFWLSFSIIISKSFHEMKYVVILNEYISCYVILQMLFTNDIALMSFSLHLNVGL